MNMVYLAYKIDTATHIYHGKKKKKKKKKKKRTSLSLSLIDLVCSLIEH